MTKLTNQAGLCFEIGANGAVRRIDHDGLLLNLFVGNEMEGGPANLYLRCHADAVRSIPLLGPRSPTRFRLDGEAGEFVGIGSWHNIDYRISLVLAQAEATWFWHVSLKNTGPQPQQVDLLYAQDVALASYWGCAAQRVLRQPVPGSHAVAASDKWRGRGFEAEPGCRWQVPVVGDRLAA